MDNKELIKPDMATVIEAVGDTLLAAFYLLDDSEQVDNEDFLRVPLNSAERLERNMDVLETWEDEPGYICGPVAKARHAIKCLIAEAVAAEREACAHVAINNQDCDSLKIAAAILARTK